jgi:DNA-directed RNA polymerase specialized sigma subunit
VNPVENFIQSKEAAMGDKRNQEMQQLQLWQKTQKPEHLQPLIQSYAPVIAQKIRQYKAPAVNESAFKAELHKHLINAFETFDPNRGAQLSTHVENRLRKAQRFNARYQNVAYIPEGQAQHIGKINRATNELTEQFGREPTHQEIGDHLGLSPKLITKVIGSQRKDVRASSFENDPTEIAMHRDQEVLSLLPYNLTPDENKVFNHIFGQNGAAKLDSTNDIAARLGKSPSQVSRLKSSILEKYKTYK